MEELEKNNYKTIDPHKICEYCIGCHYDSDDEDQLICWGCDGWHKVDANGICDLFMSYDEFRNRLKTLVPPTKAQWAESKAKMKEQINSGLKAGKSVVYEYMQQKEKIASLTNVIEKHQKTTGELREKIRALEYSNKVLTESKASLFNSLRELEAQLAKQDMCIHSCIHSKSYEAIIEKKDAQLAAKTKQITYYKHNSTHKQLLERLAEKDAQIADKDKIISTQSIEFQKEAREIIYEKDAQIEAMRDCGNCYYRFVGIECPDPCNDYSEWKYDKPAAVAEKDKIVGMISEDGVVIKFDEKKSCDDCQYEFTCSKNTTAEECDSYKHGLIEEEAPR